MQPGLRAEHPLKVINSKVLKEVFEPKRNEITEQWLELLHYLYFSPFNSLALELLFF